MKSLFSQLKARLTKAGASIEVTLQSLALGAPDAITGIYAKGYTPSTIDMLLVSRNTDKVVTPAGDFLQIEALGLTDTQVFEGDEIEDSDGNTFLIETVSPKKLGDQQIYYECSLKSTLPLAGDRSYSYPAPPTEGGISLNVGASLLKPLTIESILTDLVAYDNTEKTCSVGTILSIDGPRNPEAFTCSVGTILNITVV